MKKRRIAVAVILVLVLLPVGLYLTRNQWVASIMKKEVTARSKGQVGLRFQSISVDFFSGQLSVCNPDLTFKNVYFNKAAGTLLQRAHFRKLVLTGFSLWDAVLHKRFMADNLLLEKPAFFLKKGTAIVKKSPSRFNPATLLKVMENHQVTQLRILFFVQHTQIKFGEIDLSEKNGKDIYGKALYDISIENLGTMHHAGDSLHPLTFDNLTLTIRDLHRYSAPEKLNISLDSAFYSTQSKALFLRGLHLDVLGNGPKRPVIARLNFRWTRINGLATEQTTRNSLPLLHFSKMKIVGGDVTFKKKAAAKKKGSGSRFLKSLFASYRLITLDTLDLKHIMYYQIDSKDDTLLNVNRMNLMTSGLKWDKKWLKHPVTGLHFRETQLSFQSLSYGNPQTPLRIQTGNGQYDTRNRQLALEGLRVAYRCTNDTAVKPSRFAAQQLVVKNFSLHQFQQKQNQLIGLKLISPVVYGATEAVCQKGGKMLPAFLHPLKLERIAIENGTVNWRYRQKIIAGLSGIHLFADSLQKTRLSGKNAAVRFDTLIFSAQKSHWQWLSGKSVAVTGKMEWKRRNFSVFGFLYLRHHQQTNDTVRVKRMVFSNAKLNALLFGNKIVAGGLYLLQPKIYLGLERRDSLSRPDSLQSLPWNRYVKMPLKVRLGLIRVTDGHMRLTWQNTGRPAEFESNMDMQWHRFKMGYDTLLLISTPRRFQVSLHHVKIKKDRMEARMGALTANSDSGTLRLAHVQLNQQGDTSLQFRFYVPNISVHAISYNTLFCSDSLLFGKAVLYAPEGKIRMINFVADSVSQRISRWHFVFDSLKMQHGRLEIAIEQGGDKKTLGISNLNLLYHPNMRFPGYFGPGQQNLVKRWDFTLDELIFENAQQHFKMVADRIALQSESNRMSIKKIIGTNFSPEMTAASSREVYSYFLISNMSWNDLFLSAGEKRFLHVKKWLVPGAWINIINNNDQKRKSLDFLNSNFFSRYTRFLGGIHVDSSLFRDVNLSYQYEHMNKMVNIVQLGINISDIQMGKPFLPGASSSLFGTLFVNLNDRPIISGDSMYTFRIRDIRVNLPHRRIQLDSLTLTPRFARDAFFTRAGVQTDRITLYGKNAVLDNFDPDDLVNNHFLHFGKLSLNRLSMRFERDMHYPRQEVVKPMPIDLINRIPYLFRIDSVKLNKSMISYFEYEIKSKNPGIFFIDNFNVLAQNMTNHLLPGDSNLVLQFKGSGKLMKQADLDFTLAMPYFAPRRQWWFSAEAGKIDLTQFNPLTQNVLGLSVISGKGSLQVPMISGDSISSHGSVNFLYNKLKLRLYSRKKSQKSKSILSPFANFFMNRVVKSNNPPFLGHVNTGAVYFERVPEKSYINFLWKSNLSGILSTIGFNNKQQRELIRENKKQIKTDSKSDKALSKKPDNKKISR
jgi:hypothetical protein